MQGAEPSGGGGDGGGGGGVGGVGGGGGGGGGGGTEWLQKLRHDVQLVSFGGGLL